MEKIYLTSLSQAGGCGCKIDPSNLEKILATIQAPKKSEKLVVGYQTADDCAVYDDKDRSYLLFTTDFFTPVVDDGYSYGWIAAANALSDIFSMGGNPILANAILGYPSEQLPFETVKDIIQGGSDAIHKTGCILAGGHTINNPQPFYGFSIIGQVPKQNLKTNIGAQAGDCLLLTKPIGIGICTSAMKMGLIDEKFYSKIHPIMMEINQVGSALATEVGVHALTDVTGFGLLGHCLEMVDSKNVLELQYEKIPFFEGIMELAKATCSPRSGMTKNLNAFQNRIHFSAALDPTQKGLLTDPQSNGGLLIAVDPTHVDSIKAKLERELKRNVHMIGRFQERIQQDWKIKIVKEE